MLVDDLLVELGEQMKLGDLKLDENRTTRLIFDKVLPVTIQHNVEKKEICFSTMLANFPDEDKEKLFRTLLDANLFGRGTGGATFAVNAPQEEIWLIRHLSEERLDYQGFVNALEAFVNFFEAWKKRLESEQFGLPDEEEMASEESSPLGESPGIRI